MSKGEYLASRLALGGDDAPPGTSWWPRHGRLALGYLHAAFAYPGEKAILRGSVLSNAEEFEKRCFKKPSGLMMEHAALEVALVDAAIGGDDAKLKLVGGKLTENARRLSAHLSAAYPGFPSATHLRLMLAHVSCFVSAVGCRIIGDDSGACELEAKRRSNAVAMAGLMTEWSA